MKKVVNGVTYNTDTAILLGTYTKYRAGVDISDIKACQNENNVEYREGLYRRKKDGAYFLAGSGNGKYSKEERVPAYGGYHGRPHPAYDRIVPSGKVIPLEESEAEAWLAEYGN